MKSTTPWRLTASRLRVLDVTLLGTVFPEDAATSGRSFPRLPCTMGDRPGEARLQSVVPGHSQSSWRSKRKTEANDLPLLERDARAIHETSLSIFSSQHRVLRKSVLWHTMTDKQPRRPRVRGPSGAMTPNRDTRLLESGHRTNELAIAGVPLREAPCVPGTQHG